MKMMDKEKLTQRLQDFQAGKITWIELARDLQLAVEEGTPINGNYISRSKLQYLLKGYKAAIELDIASDPRILDVNPYNVG
jgi:hypothetical protein